MSSEVYSTPRHVLDDQRIDISEQYMLTPLNVMVRFNTYKFAEDRMDMHKAIVEELLPLCENAVVVDVGCGSGLTLLELENRSAVTLSIVGVEIDRNLISFIRDIKKIKSGATSIVGSAQALGLADNSADALLALFMLYHVHDQEQAVDEFYRVLKPAGRLAVATSGPTNKIKHRRFEREIAQHIGSKAPPVFANTFGPKRAEDLLSKKFIIDKRVTQLTKMILRAEDVDQYVDSLNTMKGAFKPEPFAPEWLDSLDVVVWPQIQRELEETGVFTDYIERHYYICSPKAIGNE